jgi:hypothetical protein
MKISVLLITNQCVEVGLLVVCCKLSAPSSRFGGAFEYCCSLQSGIRGSINSGKAMVQRRGRPLDVSTMVRLCSIGTFCIGVE